MLLKYRPIMLIMYTVVSKTLARRVREGREVMGLSKERFGLMVGLCGPTIRRLEQGDANVRLDTLERIAEGLGTEAWVLLRRDAPPSGV